MKCRSLKCPNKVHRRGYCYKHYERVPSGLVDGTMARAHVKALRAAGYSLYTLEEMTGLDRDTMTHLLYDKVEMNTHLRIMSVPIPDGLVDGGSPSVPNVGTKRRIQALIAAGYSQLFLATELGIKEQNIGHWLKQDRVTSGTAIRIRDLFNRLQMTPGPSKRAAAHAARKGWAPPFSWDEDEIDDPKAKPHVRTGDPGGWTERYEEYRDLGLSINEIAAKEGVSTEAIYKRLERQRKAA